MCLFFNYEINSAERYHDLLIIIILFVANIWGKTKFDYNFVWIVWSFTFHNFIYFAPYRQHSLSNRLKFHILLHFPSNICWAQQREKRTDYINQNFGYKGLKATCVMPRVPMYVKWHIVIWRVHSNLSHFAKVFSWNWQTLLRFYSQLIETNRLLLY